MKDKFEKILDECIDHINGGESIDVCLAEYSDYREELSGLLTVMFETKTAYSFKPSARAKSLNRQRFTTALVAARERRENRQAQFHWIPGRSMVWTLATTAIVTAVVIVVVGFFVLRPAIAPAPMVVQVQPSPEGNFVFLLSDEVNAISDFATMNISISKVSLHLDGNDKKIIEFEPEIQMADLTNLQGERAQKIWRGDIPIGEYSKVFLEVSQVTGILLESGEEVEIKLPSSRLQLSKPFVAEIGEEVNFVYDLTVVEAGKSGQYILKPQIDQSGVDQDFTIVEPEKKPENDGNLKDRGWYKKPENDGYPKDEDWYWYKKPENDGYPKDEDWDRKSSNSFIPLPPSAWINIWHSFLQSCHNSLPR